MKDEVKKVIEQAMAKGIVSLVQVGSVTSVSESDCSCEIKLLNGIDLFDVNLKSIIDNDNGLVLFPKVNSKVLVCLIDNNPKNAFVVAFDELEKVTMKVESFIINDGDNKGLVKLTKLVEKVNALENLLNNVLTTLKATTIPLAPSGSYPFAPLFAAYNNITPITTESDLENTKVKH